MPRPIHFSELTAIARPVDGQGLKTWRVMRSKDYYDKNARYAHEATVGWIYRRDDGPFNVYLGEVPTTAVRTDIPGLDPDNPAKFWTIESALTRVAQSLDPRDELPDWSGDFNCRRPYCSRPFATSAERRHHEQQSSAHSRTVAMTFICTDPGHADAIEGAGVCPVCQ